MNINELTEKIKKLEEENCELKQKLKTYTAPTRHKNYYENHKDDIKQKTKEYKENLSIEKKKEYARRAYLKKKEKIKFLTEHIEKENN
jgi:hypothetical protein